MPANANGHLRTKKKRKKKKKGQKRGGGDRKKQRINIVSIVMAAFTRYFTVSAIRKAIVLRSGSTIQHEYLMSLYPTASVAELSSAQLYSFAWRWVGQINARGTARQDTTTSLDWGERSPIAETSTHLPVRTAVVACFCTSLILTVRKKKVYLYRANDPWLSCSTVHTGLHSLQLASTDFLLRERCMHLWRCRLHKQGLPLPTACRTLRSPRLVHHKTDLISFADFRLLSVLRC